MPKSSFLAKIIRQDEILGCLRAQSYWTTGSLSNHLSISHRTLMRDLSELKQQGIPILSERGRGGGISLHGRWGLGRISFSNSEIITLLISLAISEQLNSPIMLEKLQSMRNRISASFPVEQRHQIEELRKRVFIGANASSQVMQTYQHVSEPWLSELSTSFIEKQKIKINYISENKTMSTRIIEPQILLLNWPIWYFLCWDELRDAVRMFRIDRINEIYITSQKFKLRKRELMIEGLENYFETI